MSERKKNHHGGWILFFAILACAYILNTNPEILNRFSELVGIESVLNDDTESDASEETAGTTEETSAESTGSTDAVDSSSVADGYAYSTLDEETKAVYAELYEAMLNFSEDIFVSTKDANVIQLAYDAVSADHPEIFWVSGYSYNTFSTLSIVTRIEVTPGYTMTAEEAAAYQQQVDAVVSEWLSGISMDASDYEKSKYVFETIIENTEYVSGSENNQNILSVFLNNESVCQGYAEATAYLLHQLGITSSVITGEIPDQGSHAFNLVLLDGSWYYMDTTWGDGSYTVANAAEDSRARTNYLYMNITTEQLEKTHVITSSFTVPECTQTEDNYYVHEGLYFTHYDQTEVGNALSAQYVAGSDEISIWFSDEEAYNQAVAHLLDETAFFYYIPVNRVSALKDGTNYVITFVL